MKDKLEIIKDFEAKTGLKLFDLVDEQVARFDDGRFYAIEDIKYHVENDLDTSLIQEYSDEGTEGCVTETYEIWLAKQK